MATSPNCRSRSSRSVRRSCLRANSDGQVAGQSGLAGPALGREQRDDLALGVRGGLAGDAGHAAGGQRVRLLDREDDPVGQLREQHDVVDAGLQRLGQQGVGAGRGDEDDRGGGDRPDRLDLGGRHVLGGAWCRAGSPGRRTRPASAPALTGSAAVPTSSTSGWSARPSRTSAKPLAAPVMKTLIGDWLVISSSLQTRRWGGSSSPGRRSGRCRTRCTGSRPRLPVSCAPWLGRSAIQNSPARADRA